MDGGIFLLLGSNMGDRFHHLDEARKRMGGIVATSSIYVTAAWGNEKQPDFYNQVIEIDTSLTPAALLEKALSVEIELGRIRSEKWGPRVIDIDILLYKDEIIEQPNLVIPHPGIQNRRFTLVPLLELTNKVHPVLKKTISELLDECKDPLPVTRLQR